MEPQFKAIVQGDTELFSRLQNALREFECGRRRFTKIQELMKFISPGEIIGNWETPFPISIVALTWWQKKQPWYSKADILCGPVIYWANKRFLEMIGVGILPLAHTPSALTAPTLLRHFEERGIVDTGDLEEFVEEQTRLIPNVFFYELNEPATVPLRFNERAPEWFRGRWLLPAIVGKNVIGNTESTHTSFWATVYIPVPNTRRAGGNGAVPQLERNHAAP
jgi:hypothetical protein